MAGRKKVRMVKKRARKGCLFFLAKETRTVVMQELFDEVYVGENHTPAAISFQLQLVKSVTGEVGKTWEKKEATDAESVDEPFVHVFCEELKVGIPFVANNFPT